MSMSRRPAIPLLRPAALLLVALAVTACDPRDPEPEAPPRDLGMVDFPTSCSEDAQGLLDQGLILLHHMKYVQAEDTFELAVQLEEDCAMAHWGLAMTQFHPLWPGDPSPTRLLTGREAVERGLQFERTEREDGLLQALSRFYEGIEVPYQVRLERWEMSMAELNEAFPRDPEVATLYALSHLAVNPQDEFRQRRAAAILRPVHEEMPFHPGAIHYSIHAHDSEEMAEDGIPFVEAYEEILPEAPHALHTASRPFLRLGDWDGVIEWNRRAADTALEEPRAPLVSHHFPHALDHLIYAYLQTGQDRDAEGVLEELRRFDAFQPTFMSAYALAAIPARWHLERRDWEGATELEPRVPADFPWDEFPAAEAMTHMVRGIGWVWAGDLEEARASMDRLEVLESREREADNPYWADRVRVQRESVEAWVRLAEGEAAEAIDIMNNAAQLEEELPRPPVVLGALPPAHELLGDLIRSAEIAGEWRAALQAYESALLIWPRRWHSLMGAAQTADLLAEHELADRLFGELGELAEDADPDRMDEIREFRVGG
jgi:tetratricopeptide (TPR) repeat protein